MNITKKIVQYIDYMFCLSVLCYVVIHDFNSLLVKGTDSFLPRHDPTSWYGVYNYFFESAADLVLPYWNPYADGGVPFYFTYPQSRLMDPLSLIPIFLINLCKTDIYFAYHWYYVSKFIIMMIGFLYLLKYIFKTNFITSILFIIILRTTLTTGFFVSNFLFLDTLLWVPLILYLSIRAYNEVSTKYIIILGYILGIYIGASSYHSLFFLISAGTFLIPFLITDYKNVYLFITNKYKSILTSFLLIILLCIPLILIFIEKNSIFPVLRTACSREVLEISLRTKSFTAPFLFVFSPYSGGCRGNYLKFENAFDFIVGAILDSSPLEIFFVLYALLLTKFKYKFHLIVTIAVLFVLAIAGQSPVYKFLYENVPLFNMMRHTSAFTSIYLFIKVVFVGYGLIGMYSIFKGKYLAIACKFIVLTIIFYVISLFNFISGYWYLRLLPFLLTLINSSMIKIFFVQVFPNIKLTSNSLRSMTYLILLIILSYYYLSTNNNYFINIPSITVSRLEAMEPFKHIGKYNFNAKPLVYNNYRSLCFKYLTDYLLQAEMTQTNIALTSFLEVPPGLNASQLEYLKQCPSTGIRTLYWPQNYLRLYLMGEKNINAFKDIMGVDKENIRFYTTDSVVELSDGKILDFFLNYHQKNDNSLQSISDNILFVEPKERNLKLDLNNDLSYNKLSTDKSKVKFKYDVTAFNANFIQIKVDVNQKGMLLYNDTYDRHWRAKVNGENVLITKANANFKAIELLPGTSTINFIYKPVMLNLSINIYLIINFCFITYFFIKIFIKIKKNFIT